jgi:hypothetical protein
MGLLVAGAVGCEPVDDGAATRNKGWNGELSDNVLDNDRPVFNTIEEDPADVSADGCKKTTRDAHTILMGQCASCHDGPAAQGLPPWNFVLDDQKMMTETWLRQDAPPVPFLKPGDPDNSAIFIRAANKRDMPPIYTDLSIPTAPRVTYSEASVLRQWISHCMTAP